MTRIKICGLTRPEDAIMAAKLGADAIGLVFFSGSKRHVSIASAQKIIRTLPPFISVVGLFVNETAARIHETLAQVPLDMLQFHGDESPEFCRQFARPYLKAVRVRTRADIQHAFAHYADARAIVLDHYVEGEYGGTGQTFDWQMLPEESPMPWILSGGLKPDNVAHALRQTHAIAVDVSSGVESASGIKDPDKMRAFIAACRAVSAR